MAMSAVLPSQQRWSAELSGLELPHFAKSETNGLTTWMYVRSLVQSEQPISHGRFNAGGK